MNTDNPETSLKKELLFNQNKTLFYIFFVIILLVGLGIRFYDLTDAPLDFHPTRQLFSALKARGMFYENLKTAPEWQREFAIQQWKKQGFIEPPVMERITAFFYQVLGMEALWIPRVLAILFWTIGGVFLMLIALAIIDRNAAIIAFLLFMVTPYSAIASRAFQPDPLMVMLMIIGLWGLVRWIKDENMVNGVIAGLFSGLAIFVKSVVIFPLAFVFIAVVIFKKKSLKNLIKSPSIWVMGSLSILPYIGYLIYGLKINGALTSEFSLRFFPELWTDPAFWIRWNNMISSVIGFVIFLASIIGILLLKKPVHRVFLTALFAGYFVYGLTLPYHISTHDYYQLPFIPIAVLGASAAFSQVIQGVQKPNWLSNLVIIGVLAYYLAMNAWDVRVSLARNNYRNEVTFWQKMAEKFSPNDSLIGITQDYGYRLNYWGWRDIENWMATYDFSLRELAGQEFDMKAYFEEQIQGKDYFLVTNLSELDNQPEIKQILFDNYSIQEQTGDYIIFDLHQKTGK